jgi:hypothetical protein
MLIIISILVACGGNESIEERLTAGGVWLAQTEAAYIVGRSLDLMVFTPEGNVLYGGDSQATFEITDSTLTISSSKGDYVKEYAISVAEDGNTIFLSSSFVDGSENTITETTTLTHHSDYKPTSLSSLNLENSFWGGSADSYIDIQSNTEGMAIFAFTSDGVAYYFFAYKEAKNLASIESIGDFTVTEDAVFITLGGTLIKFSVSVFNKDTIILTSTSDNTGTVFLQRMNPDMVKKAFPTAPVKNNDEIINGLTPGIWIMPADENGGIAFLPDGTFIDGDTLELGTYEVLAEDDSLYMTLTSEDEDWDDIFTITHSDNDTIILEGSLSGSLQLEKYVSYEATAINDINFAGNWYLFHELFITAEYQNQERGAYLLSGDDVHVVGNSVILSNDDIRMNFTAYPFSGDILYLHSPVPGYNLVMVRATN